MSSKMRGRRKFFHRLIVHGDRLVVYVHLNFGIFKKSTTTIESGRFLNINSLEVAKEFMMGF